MSHRMPLHRDQICRLLRSSREAQDARIAPLVTLALAYGVRRAAAQGRRWTDLDPVALTLHLRRNALPIAITELLARQLLAIPRQGPKIFVKASEPAAVVENLMAAALTAAGLNDLQWDDLVRWSNSQPLQTRIAVATA